MAWGMALQGESVLRSRWDRAVLGAVLRWRINLREEELRVRGEELEDARHGIDSKQRQLDAKAKRAAATQRLMQMRLAQAALMPDPHYLDAPPPGMMQLCDRKSVVQFINEVRASRPHPPLVSSPSGMPERVSPAPDV